MILPLRKSASLVIFDQDDKVLLLKRTSKMSFANAHVFPGGVCEPIDKLHSRSQSFSIYSKITAIRQCFEETGILFYPSKFNIEETQGLNETQISNKIGQIWENKLHLLKPLIRLMTPQFPKVKRFDCIFFTPFDPQVSRINIRAKEKQQNPFDISKIFINEESLTYEWKTPIEFIQAFITKEITLIGAQKMILGSLSFMKSKSQLFQLDDQLALQPHISYLLGKNIFINIGDKEFKAKQVAENQPHSESKQQLLKVIDKYHSEPHDRRRMFKGFHFQTNYKEGNILRLGSIHRAKL